MAKSSIHFQKMQVGAMAHNDRSLRDPSYLLPLNFREKNEINRSSKKADKKVHKLFAEAQINYKNHFNQKIQSKSYMWEAVVNLNEHHNMKDLKELVKEVEKETGFTGVQISIHRDEGHIKTDKSGKEFGIKNYHAHIVFFTLDRKNGQQLYRRRLTPRQKETQPDLKPMDRNRLSHIQTIVAKSLNMERGKEGSNATRLGHKEYKALQRDLENSRKRVIKGAINHYEPKMKDLKEINNQLRLELQLQGQGAKREDYEQLERTIKKLKDEARAKTLTTEKMNIEIANLRDQGKNEDAIKIDYTQLNKDISNLSSDSERIKMRESIMKVEREMKKARRKLDANMNMSNNLRFKR